MAKVTGSVKHIHQYFQRPDGLWACSGIDNCTHFMPKNMSPAPLGRQSVCWGCNKSFMLTPVNMEETKPMCDACLDGREVLTDATEQMLQKGLAAFRQQNKPKIKIIGNDRIEVDDE